MNTRTDLEAMVGQGEQILWRGKPQKKCFIFECIFNPMLFFALLWASFDIFFIVMANKSSTQQGETSSGFGGFMFVFFAFHMMPVWIYLAGVIFSFRKYRNTEYIVTEKGVYISGGVFTYSCQMKSFAELSNVNIHRGIFDQMFGVGDVILTSANLIQFAGSNTNSQSRSLTMCDIADYQEVFAMVKQLQQDIYSDTMYPNDLRPAENHGYQTKYRGRF
ncbi:MAG: PH domain-containing protein [Ruminococcus sp.]|nr:PH domain-containing protein [Ruminococcus sp.]